MKRTALVLLLSFSFLSIGGDLMALEIKSPAFEDGVSIPPQYTCKGQDVSPPLNWSGVPEGTKSIALISDDPDAPVGTWVHWVIYNIPADASGLEEGIPKKGVLPNGSMQGITDFGTIGYGGPCPPPGGPHRYYFKLYALDIKVDLKPGATKADLLESIKGHVLEEAQIMGTFKR